MMNRTPTDEYEAPFPHIVITITSYAGRSFRFASIGTSGIKKKPSSIPL